MSVSAFTTSHDRSLSRIPHLVGRRNGNLESEDNASGAGDECYAVPGAREECVGREEEGVVGWLDETLAKGGLAPGVRRWHGDLQVCGKVRRDFGFVGWGVAACDLGSMALDQVREWGNNVDLRRPKCLETLSDKHSRRIHACEISMLHLLPLERHVESCNYKPYQRSHPSMNMLHTCQNT